MIFMYIIDFQSGRKDTIIIEKYILYFNNLN